MIWEDEPSPEIAAKLLKNLGVGIVVFRPCGNQPEKGDYISVMKQNIENLKPVFKARKRSRNHSKDGSCF